MGISRDTVLYHPLYPQFKIKKTDKYPMIDIGDLWSSPLSQEKFHDYYFGPERDPRFTYLGPPLDLQIGVRPLQIDLETFEAFKRQDRIVDAWNTDIQRLMKKSDSEKRGELKIGVELPSAMESIVGEGGAGLQVSGYRRILFSGRSQWTDAQSGAAARQNKFPSLTMDQKSRFTIEGTVGSKVSVKVDQDSERQTDLENRIQIRYKGDEDDILQSVEAGNTTLSLPNTRYVGYSQRIQGLFGFKAEAQLGPLDFTMIASQEKGNTVRNRFTAGATGQQVSFRRDYQYARYRFFDIGRVGDSVLLRDGDQVVRFELYELINTTEVTRGKGGVAYENVTNPGVVEQVSPIRSRFELLGQQGSDWVLVTEDANRPLPYIKFKNQQSRIETKTLAYYMEVNRNGSRIQFGSVSGDSLQLQLLKRSNPSPDDPFWDAEWKNVYDLGLRNIDYNEFQLDIYKGQPGDEQNPANVNHQNSVPYLQILGLDRTNASGSPGADGLVDNNRAILDLEAGLLIFPDPRPFDSDVGYSPNPAFADSTLNERVPAIYETDNYTELQKETKYYFRLVSRSRSTNISLQQVNILPESEVITFNGRRLIKGSDYQIDYGIGQVTLLRDEFLDPTGELTVDYEYAPFLTAEKKSLFGIRGEYHPNNNFRTGATFLYKGSKATDRPAQLGQEPFRDLVLDYDVFWRTQPGVFTKMADAVPLVKTEAPSNLSIEAEIARSMPNPNTKGEVFIDDFESARQAYSLGILRETWTIASPPIDLELFEPKPARGSYDPALIWYNPYDQFKITDIYDREVQNNSEDRTHVLVLRFDPTKSVLYDDSTNNRREVWGGIMNGLPRGVWDQTRAELIEIRMGVIAYNDDGSYGVPDSLGTLHIDLGRISEDVNLDGQSNTEDVNRNGILDEGEDVGLDGIPNIDEPGFDPDTLPDPNGDDWFFSADQRNFVDKINGTEGNSSDFLLGRPDAEDIGGEGENDLDNAYYAFEIDLANPGDRLVPGSEKQSNTGLPLVWKTYRIPLWELYDKVDLNGQPDSNNIQFVRLWIDNAGQKMECFIAALDIIQNRWEGQLAKGEDIDIDFDWHNVPNATGASQPRLEEPRFRVEVRNTEADTLYRPPPGVTGYQDPVTDVREKEQSLSLVYENFLPGDSGRAISSSNIAQDYTGYRFMRMFVHGDASNDGDFADDADGLTDVYLKFGQDENNYYYYRRPILPGWDSNTVDIDFNVLTAFKEESARLFADSGRPVVDTFDVETGYGVYGRPSLSRVSYFEVGVIRTGAVSGVAHSSEVWLDELRLTDVRKDPGLAGRLGVTAQFADLMGFTATIDGRDYAFRTLNSGRTGSVINSSTSTQGDVRANVNLHKFGLEEAGLRLPLAVNYSKSVLTPKLLTGSDVVLSPELQQEEQTVTVQSGFSLSASWTPPWDNWLLKSTLGSLSGGFSYTRRNRTSPTIPADTSESYSANAAYRLSIRNRVAFPILYWSRFFLMPRRVWDAKFSFLPNDFNARGTVNRNDQTTINSNDLRTDTYSRVFNGSMGTTYNPFPALRLRFDMTTRRDISGETEQESIRLSANPSEFRFGREQQYTQKFGADYQPTILPFLMPNIGYSADFNDRIDDLSRDHDVNVNRRMTISNTFDLKRIWSFLGADVDGGSRRGRGRGRRPPTREREPNKGDRKSAEEADAGKADAGGGSFDPLAPWRLVLKGFDFVTSPLDPISVSVSQVDTDRRNNLYARPSMKYTFGINIDTVDVPRSSSGSIAAGQVDEQTVNRSLAAKNNIRIGRILTITNSYAWAKGERQQGINFPTVSQSTTFPDLSTGLSQLEKFLPIGWLLTNVSAKVAYRNKVDEGYIQEDTIRTGSRETKTYGFQPLINLTGTTPQGMRISFVANRTTTESSGESTPTTQRNASDWRFTLDYSFRSPGGIPLPFLRSIRINSQMSLSLSVSHRSSETLTMEAGTGKLVPTTTTSELTIQPRANYSFSSRVKGGLSAQWTDSEDDSRGALRKTHIRELGIWAEFSF
ncbi:MAG: hypothetical protein Kow0074_08510 [Candidatus Zixiibacteriota bacterium]